MEDHNLQTNEVSSPSVSTYRFSGLPRDPEEFVIIGHSREEMKKMHEDQSGKYLLVAPCSPNFRSTSEVYIGARRFGSTKIYHGKSEDQASQAFPTTIAYPRFKELLEIIKLNQQISKASGKPQCMVVEGPSNTGKTWLAKAYANSFQFKGTDKGLKKRVLYVEMPFPITIAEMRYRMLEAFKERPRRDEDSLETQLIKHIRVSEVELIILDNFDYFGQSTNIKEFHKNSNWLLALIKGTGVPLLLVRSDTDEPDILNSNQQLAQFFKKPEKLNPFNCDQEFAALIQTAETELGIHLPWHTERVKDLVNRIYYATEGIIGHLMSLLYYAAEISKNQGNQELTFDILATAFENWQPMSMATKVNPFLTSPDEIFSAPDEELGSLQRFSKSELRIRRARPSDDPNSEIRDATLFLRKEVRILMGESCHNI